MSELKVGQTEWRYSVVDLDEAPARTAAGLEAVLNEFGRAGWELVSSAEGKHIVFKRPEPRVMGGF